VQYLEGHATVTDAEAILGRVRERFSGLERVGLRYVELDLFNDARLQTVGKSIKLIVGSGRKLQTHTRTYMPRRSFMSSSDTPSPRNAS
jgi:hypothetical protein